MIEWWSAFVRNVVTVIRLIITSAGKCGAALERLLPAPLSPQPLAR
jgi:hypothetical protein